MFAGGVAEVDVESAIERARLAEMPPGADESPSIVWLAGDGASFVYPTPWGQVLDFVLIGVADVSAAIGRGNVSWARITRAFRRLRASGRTAVPSFRIGHEARETDEPIASAVFAAIAAEAEEHRVVIPPAEDLVVIDRAVIWARGRVFHAYVLGARRGPAFFADAVVPLEEIREGGIQITLYPDYRGPMLPGPRLEHD